MLDSQIIELYFARDESAIVRTDEKYGRYCRAVAGRILSDRKDAEECVNDAYVGVWNAIPPKRPRNFKLFVGIITRNIALDRFDYNRAKKRGGGDRRICLDSVRRRHALRRRPCAEGDN